MPRENKLSLFSRPSWNVGADTSALPFPDGSRLDHHSTAGEYPALQHPADPHDPYHTGHTGLGELWNSTTATVRVVSSGKMVEVSVCATCSLLSSTHFSLYVILP